MIALRIIATVLVSISFIVEIVEIVKNASTIDNRIVCFLAELWSILWCTFVIVTLWII